MSYSGQECNEGFTELSRWTKSNIESFFDNLHSYEEVMNLVDEFETLPPDGKGDVERKIVQIFSKSNSLTGYKDSHGSNLLCMDRTNIKTVQEAANKYRKFAKLFPKASTFDQMFYEKLFDVYKNYKASNDYISRLVKQRMQELSPELVKKNDTIRVLILKQFLKAAEFPKTSCLSRSLRDYVFEVTGLSEKAKPQELLQGIANISDDIFSILHQMPTTGKDAKKAFKEKWEPLFWAQDIAEGIFNDQQTTRNKLYWFAIIFEMTYYTGANNEIPCESTDIQKNLFYDYYADNLMNNLLGSDSNVEKEPTGHGINFKNFAEVIYLYFIHRQDLSPRQKLVEVKKMIQECKSDDEAFNDEQVQKHRTKDTLFYEPLATRMMKLSPDELKQVIKENYICGQKGVHVIRVASGNITAASVYQKLVHKMKTVAELLSDCATISYEHIYSIMEEEYYKTKCSKCQKSVNGKFYTECPLYMENCRNAYADYRSTRLTPAEDKNNINRIRNRIVRDHVLTILNHAGGLREDLPDSKEYEFLRMIYDKMKNKLVIIEKSTMEECIDATFLPKDDVENYVTRTKMIILYYFIFILTSLSEEFECNSLENFYDNFCDDFPLELFEGYDKNGNRNYRTYYGINECLIESGYQEINPKNIFDIMIVYFAFKNHKKFRYIDFENGGEYYEYV